MSSTNRGAERLQDDWYATPEWTTRAVLRVLGDVPPHRILEPMAGEGAIVRVLRHHWPASEIFAIELHPQRAITCRSAGANRIVCRDFLSMRDPGRFDLTLTNPAFSLAQPTIERCLEISREVVMLLRLSFLESKERVDFWRQHPADVFVLPKRPSFAVSAKCIGTKSQAACGWKKIYPLNAELPVAACPQCGGRYTVGRNDSSAYGWFCWGPGRGNRWQVLDIDGTEDAAIAAE